MHIPEADGDLNSVVLTCNPTEELKLRACKFKSCLGYKADVSLSNLARPCFKGEKKKNTIRTQWWSSCLVCMRP